LYTNSELVLVLILCKLVCLDLKCIETLWCDAVLTLLMPCIDAYVWILDNLKRCTHLSVMKCDWEALSNNALHGTYWPDLFWTSTMAVASRIWFLDLPLNEQYVLTSAVGLPLASAGGPLVADPLIISWLILPVYMQQGMMSLVTLTTHLLRTCVIPCKWLQAVETKSWLLGMIEVLLSLHFEKFVTFEKSMWSITQNIVVVLLRWNRIYWPCFQLSVMSVKW